MMFLHQSETWTQSQIIMKCFKTLLLLSICICLPEVTNSQQRYPDGGRNVIPLVRNKPQKGGSRLPYNDGTVMAHVIGSAGMNFLYYFHVLGVSCENTDPGFYKTIRTDFAFCLNKTGPLPATLRDEPLGSIPKPCVDWRLHKPCYQNLAEDYDECLANRPGLVRKGTDALRFTHAYSKVVCGNVADTEAHLHDRYMKHDLIVNGVFQCFPLLQDRIVNCVKRDKISKTLCSKFYIVHACFGKYYNDDNCHDVQPIYYMDDLFRNMSATLNCPKDWHPPSEPTSPGNGWTSTPTYPPETTGWGRENHIRKENPWPGDSGRPWSHSHERGEPFIRDHQHHHNDRHQYHNHEQNTYQSTGQGREWGSSRERGNGRGNSRVVPSRQFYEESISNNRNRNNDKPWVDVLDRGTAGQGVPWDIGRNRNNEIDTRGRVTSSSYSTSPRGPPSYMIESGRGRGQPSGRGGSGSYQQRNAPDQRGPGGGLPPAGYAVTRSSHRDAASSEFFSTDSTSLSRSEDDSNYNLFSFD